MGQFYDPSLLVKVQRFDPHFRRPKIKSCKVSLGDETVPTTAIGAYQDRLFTSAGRGRPTPEVNPQTAQQCHRLPVQSPF